MPIQTSNTKDLTSSLVSTICQYYRSSFVSFHTKSPDTRIVFQMSTRFARPRIFASFRSRVCPLVPDQCTTVPPCTNMQNKAFGKHERSSAKLRRWAVSVLMMSKRLSSNMQRKLVGKGGLKHRLCHCGEWKEERTKCKMW